jgi:hypothetical protein
MHLIKRLKSCHLIESFNNAKNIIIRTFDQVPKKNGWNFSLD